MGMFSKRKTHEPEAPTRAPDLIVQDFLRGQNLEQVGRLDEAIALYEAAVADGFDAAGPYDRLIFIYSAKALHSDVIRIARASLANVRTYPAKASWYEEQIKKAEQASRPL